MNLHTWVSFAIVALAVSLVPGPAFVTVLGAALSGGLRRGALGVAGILAGDAIAFTLAALGLGALLLSSPPVFLAVKWLGVAYLVYLGARALLSSTAELPPAHAAGFRHPTVVALTTQLANPKFLVFLAALVPPFIDIARPAAPQFALLGATFVATDAVVFGLLVLGAARVRGVLATQRARTVTQRVTGAAMLGAATRVALER